MHDSTWKFRSRRFPMLIYVVDSISSCSAMLRLTVIILLGVNFGCAFEGNWKIWHEAWMLSLIEFDFPARDYELMPKIFQLDSYDACFADNVKYSNAAYCVADVFIKPNASSRLWKIIQENSNSWKTHFRHDHLVYGICMEKCKKFLTKFDKLTQREYFVKAPKNFSTSITDPFLFFHSIEDRIEYSEAFSECINYPLRKQSQLEAFAEIQYCEVGGISEEIGNCN